MSTKQLIAVLGVGLFILAATGTRLHAEEVGINYQILGSQAANGKTTASILLEFLNLTGDDLYNLTVTIENPFSTLPEQSPVQVGTLGTTESRMIMADFILSGETPLAAEGLVKFHIQYDTADGIPRAAVQEGQPAVFIGNPTP